jgi:hypothetical protein
LPNRSTGPIRATIDTADTTSIPRMASTCGYASQTGYYATQQGYVTDGGGYYGGGYGGYGYGGYDFGRPGYNPGGLGGPWSGFGVRPGLGFGGLGRGR